MMMENDYYRSEEKKKFCVRHSIVAEQNCKKSQEIIRRASAKVKKS